jgi:MraZ protein
VKSSWEGGAGAVTGEYQHTIDANGRLFSPARLREELGSVFYVTLSMDKCLSAYSSESWQTFIDKVNAMQYVKQRKMRPLFAYAAKCELDTQGRVLLPQNLRDFAGLKKNVTVVGVNNHTEFWDSEEWGGLQKVEVDLENIRSVFEELDF